MKRLLGVLVLLHVFCTVSFAVPYTLERLSSTDDYDVRMSGNNTVWRSGSNIMFHNGVSATNVSTNGSLPSISGNHVAWLDGSHDIIHYTNGVTSNITNSGMAGALRVSGDNVVWIEMTGLFLHNGIGVSQINPDVQYFGTGGLDISGDKIAWSSISTADGPGIYMYDGSVHNIMVPVSEINSLAISGDNIIWTNFYQNSGPGFEIFLHDGLVNAQLTDTTLYGFTGIDIYEDRAVWSGGATLDSASEVYFYDGGDVVNLGEGTDVQVSEDLVVWLDGDEVYAYDGTDTFKVSENNATKTGFDLEGETIVFSQTGTGVSGTYKAIPTSAVPEPSAMMLAFFGLTWLIKKRIKK